MTEQHKIRAGDHVEHKPSGEIWVVLWADHSTGYFAPAGWPPGQTKIETVNVHKALSDEEHNAYLDAIEALLNRGEHWLDGARALRLHRPETIPAGHVDQADQTTKKAEPHKFRTGDLVRFRSVGAIGEDAKLGDWKESMCVYADYSSGHLAPACAGDAWTIAIAACELVTAATDEQHNGVLDRFESAIRQGMKLEAGAHALKIHRPGRKYESLNAILERAMFIELSLKAGKDAKAAALKMALIGSNAMAPGILLAAAQELTIFAAAAFATSLKPNEPVPGVTLENERTLAVWKAIMSGWSLAPDAAAAEKKIAEGLAAIAPADFVMTGTVLKSGADR